MPTHDSFRDFSNFRHHRRGFLNLAQTQVNRAHNTTTKVFSYRVKALAPGLNTTGPQILNATGATSANLPVVAPPSASLVNRCPKPYDQLTTSSCSANAEIANYQILAKNLAKPLSRLYLYAGERELENGLSPVATTTPAGLKLADNGADPSDGMTWFRDVGVVPEEAWPFDVNKVNTVPPDSLRSLAGQYKIKQSRSIAATDLTSLKVMIARGFPMCVAIGVYNSFMSDQVAQTGTVPLPNPLSYCNPRDWRDPFVGGHEVICVGYDDATQLLTFLNSWGPNWGNKGFFTLPYAYLTNPNLVMSIVGIVEI